jgi:SSS family solute:Na+ symporter
VALHPVDLAILAVYFAAMIIVGFALEKRAGQGMSSYFLGGNQLPWWILSLSNAASMFDISGTMWLVYLLFVYGMKSVFIPWLWPVFNQIFLMVYLSSWLRRSGALTGGDWITLRFGSDRGSEASRISVVFFALVSVIAFTSYAFVGIGKFVAVFLPPTFSANQYGLIIVAATTLYTAAGGLYSVVITDVIQFFIMTVACLAIGYIAMHTVSPEMLHAAVPEGWTNLRFGWRLALDWTGILDSVNETIQKDGYSIFGAFFMMMLFKGILVSAAGPAPNYDMQRILAAKSPREASLMSGFVSVILFFPRYIMVAGITVLALVFLKEHVRALGPQPDFEQILPLVIRDFVPVGLVGVLLSGLVAAFMSNFAGTVNAAAAYIVNDVYRRYVNKTATEKTYVRVSYVASVSVVVAGCGFGFFAHSVNTLTAWIVSAFWGGYAAPNILKWYWWRMNGWGYFWGMMGGILGALAVAAIPSLSPLTAFPILLLIALVGSVAGSLFSVPQNPETLKGFYRRTRPWGFWGPIHQMVVRDDPTFEKNDDFGRDAVNVAVGTVWQTALIALPIYVVIRESSSALACVGVIAVTGLFLKKNWYDRIETAPANVPGVPLVPELERKA